MEVKREDGRTEIIKYEFAHDDKNGFMDGSNNTTKILSKYRSCIIDTVSAPQNQLFQKINEDRNLNYD